MRKTVEDSPRKVRPKERIDAMSKTVERLRDLGAGRRDAIMLDPRIIQIETKRNPRLSPEGKPRSPRRTKGQHQSARRASAAACTLRRAATVSILVDGECRLRAVLELIEEGRRKLSLSPCYRFRPERD